MKTKLIAAAAFALLANTASAGVIVNGDFGTGDFTGWKTEGDVMVTGTVETTVAALYAGRGEGLYTTISQAIELDAGDVLTGYAEFFSLDYGRYNDTSFVSIGGVQLFARDVSNTPQATNSGPVKFSYTAATAGVYQLVAGVANIGDNVNSSYLHVWNFAIADANPVPEPGNVALFGLGLFGAAAVRRKFAAKRG
jgi:hypothetical protein